MPALKTPLTPSTTEIPASASVWLNVIVLPNFISGSITLTVTASVRLCSLPVKNQNSSTNKPASANARKYGAPKDRYKINRLAPASAKKLSVPPP